MIARSFLLMLGVTIGAVGTHYMDLYQWQQERIDIERTFEENLQQALTQQNINANALAQQLSELEVKSVLDQSAIASYNKETSRLQEELAQVKAELAFYEELLPAGPAGTISIRSVSIHKEGSLVNYRVLLSRHVDGDRLFKGQLQFQAKGLLDGKEHTVDLVPAAMSETNDLALPEVGNTKELLKNKQASTILSVEFMRWQQAKGNLVLPNGFIPQEVTVNILEGKFVRATKTVNLSDNS